jgi:hypothetical protein
MANPEHLEILQQGVKAWNQWRTQPEYSSPEFHWVSFPVVDLSGADLPWANLGGANLRDADLRGASLLYAALFETAFGDTDLTAVQGLETCHHQGPSTLDHRTLTKSGPLPQGDRILNLQQ